MDKKIKILHLEDSITDSRLIHTLIESAEIGHDYFLADNENDFKNILETKKIDLILSDHTMPGYDGLEAFRMSREKYSDIPFIFVSGTLGEDRAIDAMLNGATDYVVKNKLERLVPAIKRAIHEHELEIKSKQAEAAQHESEKKYKDFVNEVNDGYFITNDQGIIVFANNTLAKILGFTSPEKLIGQFSSEDNKTNYVQRVTHIFKNIIENKKKVNGQEMEVVLIDGNTIYIEIKAIPVYKNQIFTGMQGVVHNITERKLAEINLKEKNEQIEAQNVKYLQLNQELAFQNIEKEKRAKEYFMLNEELIESLINIQKVNEELNIAKVKAEESDNLKSAFLANMSHEIRTPMNAIVGFSGFLLNPELAKDKFTDFVEIINASSQQLLSIISDIIDISKIDAGQINVDLELVNINNLLNELFVIYKKVVELKKINFLYLAGNPNDLIQVKTDGNRIKQVLCNLLNNAVKFTKEGNIEFGYKIKESFIEFYVQDTGIGMAPENHELIFQRFRQVETTLAHVYGGNGLGLSISKALVEKLGGTISVASELGTGSTFNFTIPYLKEVGNIANPLLTNEPGLYINWNEKTILLVEDETINHAYIEEVLLFTKVKILHAWDGQEAVEYVKNHSDISLVLMDIKMPIMDGYEAVRFIKQMRPKLPVIAQTAYALIDDKAQMLNAGFDNYISKPIPKVALIELISGYIC